MYVFIRVPLLDGNGDAVIAVERIISMLPLVRGTSILVDQHGYINTGLSLDQVLAIVKNAKECLPDG